MNTVNKEEKKKISLPNESGSLLSVCLCVCVT